jgi:hypothetical protein
MRIKAANTGRSWYAPGLESWQWRPPRHRQQTVLSGNGAAGYIRSLSAAFSGRSATVNKRPEADRSK